ncbi:MAG: hypothetical protein A2Z83_02985 [Omnitrophica bacterium GWA2_52_8]|nr:MAG: hypothetical protein A2Z83_02985 [Omnitrophica bacterium GWA2_52_8]
MTRCEKVLFLAVLFCFGFTAQAHAGAITGKANFSGQAPAPEAISMNADPACAAAHASPPLDLSVVVNPDNTLQNVFVYVKSGLEGKTFDLPAEAVTLDQKGCMYYPHVFGIRAGQSLEIVNSDPTLHNVHNLATNSKEFNLGMPIQGMKLKKTFEQPEIMVKFKCDVHPWMHAYIGILEHPFFSVTGDSGTFEIKDLPPGTYTVGAWHEKYGVQEQTVTVGDGETKAVDFNFQGA